MNNHDKPDIDHLKIGRPNSKYLVFTSAGDHSNLELWLDGNKNFDLWVTYYGEKKGRYRKISDFYNCRKDGKFPNFYYVFQLYQEILDHYDAIMVMDDDIIINGTEISRLFKIREEFDLWVLQPAFDPRGKISIPITRMRLFSYLRFTNFVEVTCPLFKKDKLEDFMKVFDPTLVGWGIDWWFIETLGPDLERKVAIVDAVSCINPHDITKGGEREIDQLQKTQLRIEKWDEVKKKYNLIGESRGRKEFGYFKKPSDRMIRTQRSFISRLLNKIWIEYLQKKYRSI